MPTLLHTPPRFLPCRLEPRLRTIFFYFFIFFIWIMNYSKNSSSSCRLGIFCFFFEAVISVFACFSYIFSIKIVLFSCFSILCSYICARIFVFRLPIKPNYGFYYKIWPFPCLLGIKFKNGGYVFNLNLYFMEEKKKLKKWVCCRRKFFLW